MKNTFKGMLHIPVGSVGSLDEEFEYQAEATPMPAKPRQNRRKTAAIRCDKKTDSKAR